ncbi:glycoside hydrolase family 13 protein [Lyngbya confervoides]|uniref:Alpha-glucosidase n=1 Tax=Lyngbya confervoides BDU141951 TaxID=1574623 RepID=A0ABD4T938_9CYAN|nr:alpha-glucosidase [Lyngbya confervoides]MCM1984837.1 alpha-glucosidase [Lyngbya confervoides BDU141951]
MVENAQTSTPYALSDFWRGAVIYQIYPLTFADGNGDGIGDLRGIIRRLDYLNDGNPQSQTSLGVDAIWLSPINHSPMVDNGYDISDYCDIAPVFGTLKDFRELLREAHRRGIRVILDLVVNHTSNKHPWFMESAAGRHTPKADWYLWQDPMPGGKPPNNWLSYFGGSGWEYCEARGQYYFHTFNVNQPDLNWHNPQVKRAVFNIVRYWLDMGVDGFRLDASSVFIKDPFFRDNPLKYGESALSGYRSFHHIYDKNLPDNHQIIQDIRAIIDEYDDRLLIGETFIDCSVYDSIIFYGVDNDELHLPITFEFPFSPWYPGFLQRLIEKQERLTPPGAWPTYFLDNHDIPRHLARWVDCSLCVDSRAIARAAATLLLTIRGTPLLYYGQELGMVDNDEIPPEFLKDAAVMLSDVGNSPLPRDGARTPMQWDRSIHAGFSFGQTPTPFLPVHENYFTVNVETELQHPDSILNFYRRLIQTRRQSAALRLGDWKTLVHFPHEHLAYLRSLASETVLVLINFSFEKPLNLDYPLPPGPWRVLLSTHYPTEAMVDLSDTLNTYEVSLFQQRTA